MCESNFKQLPKPPVSKPPLPPSSKKPCLSTNQKSLLLKSTHPNVRPSIHTPLIQVPIGIMALHEK